MWLPQYATRFEKLARVAVVLFALAVAVFLMAPLLIVPPLSFSDQPFFSLPAPAYSLRWYYDFFGSDRWIASVVNSLLTGLCVTVLATVLGTLASLGLSRADFPAKGLAMAILISPMIVPVVIVAVGAYLFYGNLGLANTRTGLVLAHTALALPFVIVTVTATLTGYDRNLSRAAASLGAPPLSTFFRVTLPMIAPGVASGAVFAFATSFDEVVVALFLTGAEQRTLPVQMFSGIRDQISPTIMAAATLLIGLSASLFLVMAWLTRRAAKRALKARATG